MLHPTLKVLWEAASLGYLVGIPRPGKQLVPFPYMYC